MVVFVVINMFMFAVCKERVVENKTKDGETEHISFFKGLQGLVKNKYWLLLVAIIFVMYFMMSCFFGGAVYYAQYNLGNAEYYAAISNLLSIAQIATLFATPFLLKKFSKKQLMLFGMILATAGFAATGLFPNYGFVCAMSVVKGIGFGCSGACMFGLLQDAITYGEWHNGYGTAGMGNAASSFCMKIGSGIGTAALGWILGAGGFDAKLAEQTGAAITSINISFAWIPAITMAIAVVCLLAFDLDKKWDMVIEDLKEGKHRSDSERIK
jgi:GPH family glycoside/pentoside/hexuronide:cation symporter